MSTIHYTIVEHDGGWTYKVGDVFAETFASRDAAEAAARRAATEQQGFDAEVTDIVFQDADGRWREEHSDGATPKAVVD